MPILSIVNLYDSMYVVYVYIVLSYSYIDIDLYAKYPVAVQRSVATTREKVFVEEL